MYRLNKETFLMSIRDTEPPCSLISAVIVFLSFICVVVPLSKKKVNPRNMLESWEEADDTDDDTEEDDNSDASEAILPDEPDEPLETVESADTEEEVEQMDGER